MIRCTAKTILDTLLKTPAYLTKTGRFNIPLFPGSLMYNRDNLKRNMELYPEVTMTKQVEHEVKHTIGWPLLSTFSLWKKKLSVQCCLTSNRSFPLADKMTCRPYSDDATEKMLKYNEYQVPLKLFVEAIERAARAEKELNDNRNEINLFESILGLRSRIERLEKHLFPKELPDIGNRALRWSIILEVCAKNYKVKQIRDRLEFYGVTVTEFANFVSDVYKGNSILVHQIKPPLFKTKEEIENILANSKINLDEPEKNVIKVLLEEIDFNNAGTPSSETVDDSFRFILLKNVPESTKTKTARPGGTPETNDAPTTDDKIKTFFRKEISILRIKKRNSGCYIVEFASVYEAIRHLFVHEAAIDNRKITISLVNDAENEMEIKPPQEDEL